MSERIAVYPGSFDPPTYGHLDLIERAEKVFDYIIVAVANNTEKNSLFSVEEKLNMLRECTSGNENVEVAAFKGLTVDYARERGAVAIIRGLRAVSDFEYELSLASMNRRLNDEVDTVSFMPSDQYMFVSSRLVKEIAALGGDVSEFVTPLVLDALKAKLAAG